MPEVASGLVKPEAVRLENACSGECIVLAPSLEQLDLLLAYLLWRE